MTSGTAMKLALGMLGLAVLFLRGSLLGALLAGAAAVPSAYAMWLGAQEEEQTTYTYALLLFLASVGLALLLLILWLF